MKSIVIKVCSAAAFFSLYAFSGAQVYDNGGGNLLGGTDLSPDNSADTFVLGTTTSIQSVEFWDLEKSGASLDGNIDWMILSSYDGQPFGTLASGTTTYTHVATGNTGGAGAMSGYSEYVDNFTFNTPFTATAGTQYWLSLYLDPSTNSQNAVYWEWSNASNIGVYDPTFTWYSAGSAFAYRMFSAPGATPEPLTLGLGVAGVGMFLRRRMKPRS